ncbi:hypothetical protein MCNS_07450 [Mycobacterium conspicuum]|jgi:hypothetical protein|uniref:Uncharacterized protein n=2 Tax=Mycobacterium conspicuum TaxID=44010 RepID=A0A7I7Y9G7_9MYCO|nr:hypothetical protein [Mycobacterium conspicuum]BBZ37682.1 hypothetical protein MCNS_07450 [Mycobacterium conspicuum]
MRSVLVGLMVLSGGFFLPSAPPPTCQPAELFITDNTDPLFEIRADVTIALAGAAATGSTPLDGVYWSTRLQQTTAERSREFHLCSPDEPTLHALAEALRTQFHQEAVLTFDYLPQDAPDAHAVAVTVPDVDLAHFRDALVSDSTARRRLRGGSVAPAEHTLILITDTADLDVARRLVTEAGGRWDAATIAYGRREFVEG